MKLYESIAANIYRGPHRKLFFGSALLMALIVGVAAAALALPPHGAYDLLITQASINHQNAGFCTTQNPTGPQTCREWCITTIEGYVLPQGTFVCVDQ